jgi:hypothetical protein
MGNRGWGDFGLAAAELIGARNLSRGKGSAQRTVSVDIF